MIKFPNLNSIKLDFHTPTIKVCFAQLQGPMPRGKREIFIQGRQTYEWDNKEEVEDRLIKVRAILKFIEDNQPDTNIVIFPEYSAPSIYLNDVYREYSNKLNCVIVGSPDNIHVDGKIYNKAPIYLPNVESTIWITKRHLSQWEAGYIDEPVTPDIPIFFWEVDGKRYWVSIHICLDFLFSLDEHYPPKDEPVLMLVTMCSPDIMTFNNFADTHFIHPGGRAVILSNCVGGQFAGRSAIFAETPSGTKFFPAFYIRDKQEAIAFVEIDCDRYKLPKKSTTDTKSCIGQIFQYRVNKLQNAYVLTEAKQEKNAETIRAVVNPNLFEVFGKKIRLSFLGIGQYGKMDEEKLQNSGIEIYSLLGNNDLLVTQLNSSINSLINEINQLLPSWHTHTGITKQNDVYDLSSFPYFEVSKYYKVLGMVVDDEANKAFNSSIPNEEELLDLLSLSGNWESQSVNEERKKQFLEKRWVLGKTDKVPGEINVIMSIRLTSPEMDTDRPWNDFNLRILPFLLKNEAVTSIYEGTNHRANINYILRIKTKVDELFQFLTELHSIGVAEEVLFTTNTYVIVKKWSSLSLEKSLPLSGLTPMDERFRDTVIFPVLENAEDRSRFKNLPSSQQSHIVNRIREIQRILDEPYSENSNAKDIQRNRKLMPEIIYGISFNELKRLTLSHGEFQSTVEDLLNTVIQSISESSLSEIIKELQFKGKEKARFTYFEKIHISLSIVKRGRLELLADFEESCKFLIDETVALRNGFAHSDFDRISIESYCKAMRRYAQFIKEWQGSFV
jgi:hypothetical protein